MAKWDLEKSEKRMKKQMKKKSKQSKNKRRTGCSVIMTFLLMGIFAGIGAAVALMIGIATDTPTIDLEDYTIKNISTVFYDKNGKEIDTAHGGENRTLVSLTDVPKYLVDAFISIEDERYEEHNGIDLKRTVGAIFSWVKTGGEGTYGGSTITQQLVKNMTNDRASRGIDGVYRKIREWGRAIMLERELSKDQIMELYLNTICFANSTYGVKEASNLYFSKNPEELTLAECALLAGIPNRPTLYDPFTKLDNAKSRQKVILKKMLELEKITESEYNAAIEEDIVIKKGSGTGTSAHSYFVDAVIEDVIADLKDKKNMSETAAANLIYGGGLRIYTTQDSDVQAAIDEIYVEKEDETFAVYKNSEEQPESAMVILDYKTGHIVGLAGGRGEKKGKREFNRATQAKRQPGSTIKPLAVYGPAIEDGTITSSTIISDTPLTVNIPGSKPWSPTNWYGKYYGNVTTRYAVEQSMNIPAVRVLQMIGLDRSYNTLISMGITTLDKRNDKNYAPLSLGGLTQGITLKEWTAAYGMIANGGLYVKPVTYTKVEDSNGTIILQNKREEKRIFKSGTAYVLTDIMKGVVTKGTARSARLNNSVVAGKTGSTSDTKDKWFVGYTPYYAASVWVGYDEQKTISVGGEISKQIFKKVMDIVHKDLPSKDFTVPDDAKHVAICSTSNALASSSCGSNIKNEWFVEGTEPTAYCSYHGGSSWSGFYPEGI